MTLLHQSFTPQAQRNRAFRLVFSYQGNEVQLTSQQRLEMMTVPSDRIDEYEGQSGFWYELKNADDRVVYRRVTHNPIRLDIEAPSGDPERPFTHVKASETAGTFILVVPDLEQAHILAIFASSATEPSRPAMEIARFDLKEDPRQQKEKD